MQRDAFPRERQPGLTLTRDQRGVQGGVQECRVQAESGRVDAVGQGDLGVGDAVLAAPGVAQPLEDGSVLEAHRGEVLVAALGVQGRGTGGRPHRGVEGGLTSGRAQNADRVLRPRFVVGSLGTRVDLDGPAAVGVGVADPQLHLDAAALGDDQRCGQGQLFDAVAADLVARADRELQISRAGQQNRAAHGVIDEPRVGLAGETAGEQRAVLVGERDRRGEQRVVCRAEAGGARVVESAAALGPVVPGLEGIRRQVDALRAGVREERLPVDLGAADVEACERGGDRLDLVAALAEQRDGALFDQRGEDAVGADLQELGDAVGCQPLDAVGEPDCLADVAHPVVR